MTLSHNKSPDLRVVKTHKAIREAFIILLSEQEYNDIAIQAILDRAKVNRATFFDFLPSLKWGDSFCKTVKPHRKP